MMITQRARMTSEPPPVTLAEAVQHLRLDGFEDDTPSMLELQAMIWAALRDLEDLAQIAVFDQTITATVTDTTAGRWTRLPIGPVKPDTPAIVFLDVTPYDVTVTPGGWLIELPEPVDLAPAPFSVTWQAGFGTEPWHIPQDIKTAILNQTANYWAMRGDSESKAPAIAPALSRVAARYRGVRL